MSSDDRSARCGCLAPGLGIALAGGGGRGLAQIGVLEVLDEEEFPVEYVAGTSIGALFGALYALEGDAAAVEARVKELLDGAGGRPPAIVRRFRALARRDPRNPDMPVLDSGRRVILASGDLAQAVYASMALPGLLPPAEIDGLRLADGAFAEPVPVDTCRMLGAGKVIAVDVLGKPPESLPLNTGLEVVMRADEVARFSLEQENLLKADLIVTPEVEALDFGDFSNPGQRIALGERAAREQRDALRELVDRFESMFVRTLPGADAEPASP